MATQSVAAASHGDLNRNSLFNMKGRVALVTGGGSGIGLMITQALAVNGAKVYVTGRTEEKLDRVVETYNQDIEGEIIALTGFDVTKKNDIVKLVKEIESREECLCILVNNAGISSNTVTTETDTATEMKQNLFDVEKSNFDDWTSVYSTNVAAVFFTSAAFLPLLQKSSERHEGWSGTILNITSISGMVQVAQHHFAYNASKGAAIHLTRMLASEIQQNGHKIRVNSLAPGVFPSEMTAGESDEYQKSHIPKEKYASKVPAARPGRDVDMAQAVLFAVTNQYLNGQNFAVDGGYTLAAGL
ncbi:Rhamnolipids biosynthesis 3-oxoacyl-[acyl-carrier-protein] reductase [Cytospora mali]|uniref:Rhamnolipids biosynthesis 3-oxoacyl-[acyl-carrier-protein] reductase n=1 Tax=Cytospora mali TaxID=578113 RepID=A0A194URH2_CYTMA|nr:Rhamnolipids biosynthesis 3-oxoacyl-[acyl-carrier-protein] reductase [Valsa mali var. pyri (nom. inval.)]